MEVKYVDMKNHHVTGCILKGWWIQFPGGRTSAARFFFLAVLLLIWGVTRWPWLSCDGGTPAFWEYGYFVTDEGYYLSGGKEKFCFGMFVDVLRGEACTFGFSPLTHLLCWLSYRVFGLE